ncbi:hypothetical protein [Legionella parisiensis]|uniref:Dot/Icm T4SS effector n=1 Tax=Legionella parisiensis TaxID=45071 RepID=A0A1E5JUF7_9GAMM|nr:hypothetical protein [Legionella parisiensis]KTD43123.1 Dot/Icm T4SS effector [Legionella parisiensis]OEH48003.1 hypothetical protein lpari_01027 [Legionella parisiensis]STX77798.1 Dot/Icm T4SS effector [Legionella parisiensis]
MDDAKIYSKNWITNHKNDLLALLHRLPRQSANYARIRSVLNIIRQIAIAYASSPDFISSGQKSVQQKLLHDLYEQLHASLTENNHGSTWFTRIIDSYCAGDQVLQQRLNHFIQQAIGPVIKLSEGVKDKNKSLAIEFPDQEMRDIFLNRLGLNKETDSTVIHENRVYLPAFISKNQQLAVTFRTIKSRDSFIYLLNLDRANVVTSYVDDCTLYINDRRIHDTVSTFHIAVLCPYFAERYKIQYTSHVLAQAYRDGTSFFSQAKFPLELAVKIASDVSSSEAISMDEKMQIAYSSFCRP